VDATNNRAERAERFAVLWRKRSNGTDSAKGNRWVERSLSLRHTCRQLGQSTYPILVEALSSLFHGRQPNLAWLYSICDRVRNGDYPYSLPRMPQTSPRDICQSVSIMQRFTVP
jgi:hypothetical protein